MKNLRPASALVVAAALVAFGCPTLWAQHAGHGSHPSTPAPSYAAHSGKVKGKVVELDKSSLTVETQQKGDVKQELFLMAERTKIKGNLKPGAEVVVKYLHESGARIASSIEVKKARRERKS